MTLLETSDKITTITFGLLPSIFSSSQESEKIEVEHTYLFALDNT